MKLLITGENSYVGMKVADYIKEREPYWVICQLDVRTDEWKDHDFSYYDAVYHVAGLVHRKITPDIEQLYYKVNCDLAVEVAERAKNSGVKHFVFMSSMSVYSDDLTYVDMKSPTNPDNAYGKSKLLAEQRLMPLNSERFVVSIIRPPMIYGKGCKGNYNSLRTIALKSPVFPKVNNKRSMLFIDNFSEFLYQLIRKPKHGIFFPQDAELVNTTKWVKYIAEEHSKIIFISSVLGFCARIGMHIPGLKRYCIKAFGDSYYDPSMSTLDGINYQLVNFRDSIHLTEA